MIEEVKKTEEVDTDVEYFKVHRLPKNHSVKDIIDYVMKKIPKRVTWATVTLHINKLDDCVVYDHDNKRILKDRRHSEIVESYHKKNVVRLVSNILYNEHYYDIYLKEAIR